MVTSTTLSAVLFDFDGTIADTRGAYLPAYREVCRRYTAHVPSDAEIVALFGPSEEGIILKLVGQERVREAIELYLSEYERLHQTAVRLFAGIEKLIDALRSRSVRVGLVTGKGRRSTLISLRVLGLSEAFDCVLTGSPSGNTKAQQLVELLADWQLDGSQAAYCGDTPSDMQAARTAGVTALAAAWAAEAVPAELAACKPTAMFHSVTDLADWLAGRI